MAAFRWPCHSSCVMLPARSSAQYFHVSEAAAEACVRSSCPRSIGPAGRKTVGRSMLIAPIRRPGVVLSQPPISTQPSNGIRAQQFFGLHREESCGRASWSAFWNGSASVITGISTGKTARPARMPRFTSSTRCLKCVWHEFDLAPRIDDRDHRACPCSPTSDSPSAPCASDDRTTADRSRRTSDKLRSSSGVLRFVRFRAQSGSPWYRYHFRTCSSPGK